MRLGPLVNRMAGNHWAEVACSPTIGCRIQSLIGQPVTVLRLFVFLFTDCICSRHFVWHWAYNYPFLGTAVWPTVEQGISRCYLWPHRAQVVAAILSAFLPARYVRNYVHYVSHRYKKMQMVVLEKKVDWVKRTNDVVIRMS